MSLSTKLNENISLSYCSMEGLAPAFDFFRFERDKHSRSKSELTADESHYEGNDEEIEKLINKINTLFYLKSHNELDHDSFTARMLQLYNEINLTTFNIDKYTFWDSDKPYTRNLVATDDKHYSLLLLCWNAGKESKVHNHPGDGCYLKTVRGSIRETRYQVDPVTDEILPSSVKFLSEGQCKLLLNSYIVYDIVSLNTYAPIAAYIDDSMGLHKIGNPCPDVGAVTLHLYTPPFKSCKVWTDLPLAPTTPGTRLRTSVNDPSSPPTHAMYYKDSQDATVGFFSVYGVRTPHLEGTYAHFRRLMTDLLNRA